MKALATYLLGCLLLVATGAYAVQQVSVKGCKEFDVDKFNRIAHAAFTKRKFFIEKDDGDSVIGARKKYKVEIVLTSPETIEIRWVPGFGYRKDHWLDRLSRDITTFLVLC